MALKVMIGHLTVFSIDHRYARWRKRSELATITKRISRALWLCRTEGWIGGEALSRVRNNLPRYRKSELWQWSGSLQGQKKYGFHTNRSTVLKVIHRSAVNFHDRINAALVSRNRNQKGYNVLHVQVSFMKNIEIHLIFQSCRFHEIATSIRTPVWNQRNMLLVRPELFCLQICQNKAKYEVKLSIPQ
jgi:hypothetical protein